MDNCNIVMLNCNLPNIMENKLYFTVGTNPKLDFAETERYDEYILYANIHLVICSVMFAVYFLMPIVFVWNSLVLSTLLTYNSNIHITWL
jgi:hypothetical protein